MRRYLALALLVVLVGSVAQAQYNVQTLNSSAFMSLQTKNNYQTYFNITLVGNVSSVNIDTAPKGAKIDFNICQDATGGRTWVWPSTFQNTSSISISSTASACTQASFITPDGTNWNNAGAGGSSSASSKNVIDGSNATYGLFWDTQLMSDGAWPSGVNPTVTSNQATFTAADIGKTFKGTSGGTGCGENQALTSVITLTGTIQSVTDAHHVVINGTASAAAATSACFAYGHLDDAGTTAMENAGKVLGYCATYVFPAGLGMWNNPHITDKTILTSGLPCQVQAAQVTAFQGPIIKGAGPGQTGIVLGPLFPGTACNAGASSNACMGGIFGAVYRDFFIHGVCDSRSGISPPVTAFFRLGYDELVDNVVLRCFGQQYTGGWAAAIEDGVQATTIGTIVIDGFSSTGIQFANGTSRVNYLIAGDMPSSNVGMVSVASNALLSAGTISVFFGPTAANTEAIVVASGSTLQVQNLFCGENLGTNVHFGVINLGTTTIGGGQCVVNGNAAGGIPIANQSGGKIFLQNLRAQGGSSSQDINNPSGGTIIDLGGNIPVGGHVNSAAGSTWGGIGAFKGSCSGVATASSTLGLYGLGETAALTCTSTVTTLGQVAKQAGTAYGLVVSATAAGVNASSGVVTVLKNGALQTMTCTIGTGTSCADNTHTFSFSSSDVISVQFTTQAADTLAGVTATVVTM